MVFTARLAGLMFVVFLACLQAIFVAGQTFQRLGACPLLGCILPPDQTDFFVDQVRFDLLRISGNSFKTALPLQLFDIRLEVHAPVNGTEANNGGVPDENFTFCVAKNKGPCVDATTFFEAKSEPVLEKWSFGYYEDLFAKDKGEVTGVNVAAKAYRGVRRAFFCLPFEPGILNWLRRSS